MALLHATQLYAGTVASSAYVSLYTVPAGYRIILRSVALSNTTSTATLVLVQLAGQQIYSPTLAASGSAGATVEERPWIVMGPGDILKVATGSGRAVGVIVSGSLYTI